MIVVAAGCTVVPRESLCNTRDEFTGGFTRTWSITHAGVCVNGIEDGSAKRTKRELRRRTTYKKEKIKATLYFLRFFFTFFRQETFI